MDRRCVFWCLKRPSLAFGEDNRTPLSKGLDLHALSFNLGGRRDRRAHEHSWTAIVDRCDVFSRPSLIVLCL